MLFLSVVFGFAVLVWFYQTATKVGEPAIKWAIIGFVGYWLVWWLVKLSVLGVLTKLMAKSPFVTFLVVQIRSVVGAGVAFLVRKKLLSDNAEKR